MLETAVGVVYAKTVDVECRNTIDGIAELLTVTAKY